MQGEIEIRQVEKKLRSRVKKQMEKQQKEFYLNEQMQAIQKELGGGERDEFKNELSELEQKIKQKKMSKEAKERCLKELKKLKQMSPMSAEATVVRNYLDWVIALPWEDKTEDRHDINEAERILEAEHYGLKKVKERILEYLAVQALVPRREEWTVPSRRRPDRPRRCSPPAVASPQCACSHPWPLRRSLPRCRRALR
jgi:ATP-dependent Lon protease